MNLRLVVDDNPQVMEGSGRTSLYLLLATVIFLALMAFAWMAPKAVQAQDLDIYGGAGGDDGAVGAIGSPSLTAPTTSAGESVSVDLTLSEPIKTVDSYSLIGGKGGDGGSGAAGGVGGDADFIGGRLTVTGPTFSVTGGEGGADGTADNGGQGGHANFTAAEVIFNGTDFTISSGDGGLNNGSNTSGNGGNASVTIDTLLINNIATLTFTDGQVPNLGGAAGVVDAKINTLNIAAGGSAAMDVAGLGAISNVQLTNLTLNGNSTFDAAQPFTSGGIYTLNNGDLSINGSGNTLKNIAIDHSNLDTSFSKYNFSLAGVANGSVMLTADSASNLDFSSLDDAGLNQALNVQFGRLSDQEITNLSQVTLIAADSGAIQLDSSGALANGGKYTANHSANGGDDYNRFYGLTDYYFAVRTDGSGNLVFAADGRDGYYKPYYEAMLGGHLAVRDGYRNILNIITDNAREKEMGRMVVKLGLNAGSIKTKTGSYVDSDNLNAALSLAWKNETGLGQTTVGAFAEAGSGSYDTYNGLRGVNVRGDGQTEYYGGGVFFHNLFSTNTYFEASGRFGSLDNDFDVDELRQARFDTSQTYYGAHLGVGQKIAVTDCAELDVYLKGLWTRTEGKNIRTKANERLHFKDTDSFRTSLGGRLTQGFDTDHIVKGYIGAAWEYEFDGKAKAGYVNGVRNKIDEPELKGSTAFAEAGFIIDPEDSPMSIDVGIFGLAGQQRGLGGTAGLKFEF